MLPEGVHKALFTNLFAAPLSILRDAVQKKRTTTNELFDYRYNNTHLVPLGDNLSTEPDRLAV